MRPGLIPRALFSAGLAMVTPLLWLSKASILMAYYGITSWLPTLLTALHVPIDRASMAAVAFQVGGAIGGLALSLLIDRRGIMAVALFFLLGAPIVCGIGYVSHLHFLLYVTTFTAGLFVMGVQYGLNAVSAMVYPTTLRSYGVGWSTAVSRFGAIAGPFLGAWSFALGLPIEVAIGSAALPLLLGGSASLGLAHALRRSASVSPEDESSPRQPSEAVFVPHVVRT